MKLETLQITIEPWEQGPNKILRIKVKRFPGMEYRLEEILPENDFISMFEYIWERAGREIKDALKVENSKGLSR